MSRCRIRPDRYQARPGTVWFLRSEEEARKHLVAEAGDASRWSLEAYYTERQRSWLRFCVEGAVSDWPNVRVPRSLRRYIPTTTTRPEL
jgi:hypothetical protein